MQPLDVLLPARRITDLVTTEAGSDLLVYDQSSAAIHTLNDVTASVWRALETSKSLSEVVAETGLAEDVVRAAATKLSEAGLLEGQLDSGNRSSTSRRALMKKAGVAAAIPAIVSVSAPLAANAASTCPSPCYGSIWNIFCPDAFSCGLCVFQTYTGGGTYSGFCSANARMATSEGDIMAQICDAAATNGESLPECA